MPVNINSDEVYTAREVAEMILALPEDQQQLPFATDDDGRAILANINNGKSYGPLIRVRNVNDSGYDTLHNEEVHAVVLCVGF